MAKPEQKPETGKKGKTKKFKKRERKNVPFGIAYIQASFNNTIVTITDPMGNTLAGRAGLAGIPRITQGHALRGAAGGFKCRQHGPRSRRTLRGGSGLRSGFGPRVGHPRAGCRGHRCEGHPRRNAGAAQRLPATEAASSLRRVQQRAGTKSTVDVNRPTSEVRRRNGTLYRTSLPPLPA